jgi:DNA-binding LacI/PurR family transcriptional regulator/biotin operon repressor
MSAFRVLSAVEQLVEHLRAELTRGRWSGAMPGGDRLARELGVRRSTVEGALQELEKEGLLIGQGARRRRLIKMPGDLRLPAMRIAMLRFEASDTSMETMVETTHLLAEAGYAPFYASRTLRDLGMDVQRVARFVENTEADAWVVVAGSREVLEWFAGWRQPAFALFGRRQRVDIASVGPDTTPTIAAVTRRLVELGHQRIVMLSRRERRLPGPAQFERTFLVELESHGCPVGAYNLPAWEGTKEGFHRLLEALFHLTPPTALIVHEAPQFIAVLRFLAQRGIRVPEDVSLICTDPDQSFSWCEPPMAHITWDFRMAVRRVVRWAAKVNRGKKDRRQTNLKAEFVEGGTIGPVRKK